MTGKHMNFIQELTALALTGLPVITSPSFVLTRELEEWTKIEDHVTGQISSHALIISIRLVGSVATLFGKMAFAHLSSQKDY